MKQVSKKTLEIGAIIISTSNVVVIIIATVFIKVFRNTEAVKRTSSP